MKKKLMISSLFFAFWISLRGEDVGIWFRDYGVVGSIIAAYQVEDEIRLVHGTSYRAMEAPADRSLAVMDVTYPSLFVTGTYSVSWATPYFSNGVKMYDYTSGEKLTDYDYTLGDNWIYISEFGWLYIRHYPWVYSINEQSWQFFVAGELEWNMNTYYVWTPGKGWSWCVKWHIRNYR